MKAHQQTIGKSNEWLTPAWILNPLGNFDLDPCASVIRPWETARASFTVKDDGLSKDWEGRVWLNPPFNRKERPKWMQKMAEHNDGIMLVPAACETKAFSQYVWGKCSGILMLNRRPNFCDIYGYEAKSNSGCTICLIAYGENNLRALQKSGLGVTLGEKVN